MQNQNSKTCYTCGRFTEVNQYQKEEPPICPTCKLQHKRLKEAHEKRK